MEDNKKSESERIRMLSVASKAFMEGDGHKGIFIVAYDETSDPNAAQIVGTKMTKLEITLFLTAILENVKRLNKELDEQDAARAAR